MTGTVAVIGSGVAGPAAVLALAQAGLQVHWIAPAPEAGHDPIGETLAPAANPILARLGLSEAIAGGIDAGAHRPSHTTLSAWGSTQLMDRNAILHLEGPGLVLDRRRFEADLRRAAAAAADNLHGSALAEAQAADGIWHLTTEAGEILTADALVDASGRSAIAARRHGERHRVDQLVAAHAFLQQRDDSVEPTRAVLIEAVESGWWYAALRSDGSLSVAYFTDPDLLEDTPSRDVGTWKRLLAGTRYIGRWIDDAGFAVETAPRMSSAGTTWLAPSAGRTNGAPWMAVGDCAAAFDPTPPPGMTTALWAGERSAAVLTDALRSGGDEALATYADAVLQGVGRFLTQRRDMYLRETRFPAAAFWERRHRPSQFPVTVRSQVIKDG